MNFVEDVEKNLESLRQSLIMKYLRIYVSQLHIPEVGERGFLIDDGNIEAKLHEVNKFVVLRSHLDPKANPNRLFDYNMVVGTEKNHFLMMNRYNPEGYMFFLTEEEIEEFKYMNEPLFEDWDT